MAPAWLDLTALIGGFAAPSHGGAFSWCDLGCGQGVTVAALAASYPDGQFHGIDALGDHIAHARRLASATSIGNAVFHQADFRAAADLGLPRFDYIVAHGVYSWVGPSARRDLRDFVDRHLKPGGLFYVSYNALPGRIMDLPFQRLVRMLGESGSGDSAERVADALSFCGRLLALGAPALALSPMARDMSGGRQSHGARYLAHELMGADWMPMGVAEVRADMATIGLVPAGSAVIAENFDFYMLGKRARRLLAGIAEPDLRETVRDVLINRSFRRDVFIREGRSLDRRDQRRGLFDQQFALGPPSSARRFQMQTPAGLVTFDNPVVRALLKALRGGPVRLAELRLGEVSKGDLLASALVLAAAGSIMPVGRGGGAVATFNREILARLEGPDETRVLVLPSGGATRVPRKVLLHLRDGAPKLASAWSVFLGAHAPGLIAPAQEPLAQYR